MDTFEIMALDLLTRGLDSFRWYTLPAFFCCRNWIARQGVGVDIISARPVLQGEVVSRECREPAVTCRVEFGGRENMSVGCCRF